MKRILSTIIYSVLLLSVASAGDKGQEVYPDVQSLKASLSIGVVSEKNVDINSDGKIDSLIYSSGGEETFLDILLKEKDHFIHIKLPTAECYELIKVSNHYEIKIGLGTYPQYGDIHGADKLYWYDFLEVVGSSLINRNTGHADFYREMLPKYKARIGELEGKNRELGKKKTIKDSEADAIELFIKLDQDHIQRYREFVARADKIIQGK